MLEAIGFCDNKEAFERGPNGVNGQSPGAASLRGQRGWRSQMGDVPLGPASGGSARGLMTPRGNYSVRGGWSDQTEAGTDHHRDSAQTHSSARGRGDGASSRGTRGYRGSARGRAQPGHRRYQTHHHPHYRRPRPHEDADSTCRSETEDDLRQRTRSRSPPRRSRVSRLRPDSPPFVPHQAPPPRCQLGATLVRSKHTLNPHAKPFVPRYPIRVLSVGSSSSSGSSRTDNGASPPPTTIYDPPRLRADSPPFFPGLLWGTATATSVGLRWVDQQQGEQGGAGSRIATLESRFGESVGTYPAMEFETPYPHEGACFSGDPADPWLFATHRYQGDPWMPPDLSGQLWLATPDGWSSVPPLQDHWAAPFNPPAPPHFGYPDVVPPYADMPSPPMPWSEPYITPWTKPYFTPWSEPTTTSPVVPEQYGQPLFLPLPPPPLPPIWVTAPSPSVTQNGYSRDENPHFHLPLNLMESPSSLYSPVSRPAFRPVPIRRPGTDITPPLSRPQSERNIDPDATSSGDVGGNEDPLADLYVDLHHKIREEMYGRKSWKSYQEVRARRTVSSPANLPRSVVCSF